MPKSRMPQLISSHYRITLENVTHWTLLALGITLLMQAFTGILLTMVYEPSARPAVQENGNRVVILEVQKTFRHKPTKTLYNSSELLFAEFDSTTHTPLYPIDTLRSLSRIIIHPVTKQILSPSAAYLSVYEGLMRHSDFGWLVRGVHRAAAHCVILLGILLLAESIFAQLYLKTPIHIWSANVILVVMLLANGLLGYILPFDTRSFAALEILTSTLDSTLFGGQILAATIRSAPNIAPSTLVRLAALHCIVIPLCLMGCWRFISQILQRRTWIQYGIITCSVVWICVAVACLLFAPQFHSTTSAYLPADLSQPALHSVNDMPDWYLFPIFLLLKILPSGVVSWLIIGCIVMISLLPITKFLTPFVQKILYGINCLFIVILAGILSIGIVQTQAFSGFHTSEESLEILAVWSILSCITIALLFASRHRL